MNGQLLADRQGEPWDFTDHELGVYTAGHLTGYQAGWLDGYAQSDRVAGYWEGHDDGSAWTRQVALWLGDARAALTRPMLDELAQLRQFSDAACSRGQRNIAEGRKVECGCSACTRFVACWINRRQFGTADYPGAEAALRLRGQVAA